MPYFVIILAVLLPLFVVVALILFILSKVRAINSKVVPQTVSEMPTQDQMVVEETVEEVKSKVTKV